MLSLAGDTAVLEERSGQLVAVAVEQGFPAWLLNGTMHQGWVKVANGQVTDGILLLRKGLAARRADGEGLWFTHYLALLARACEIAAQNEEGLNLINETLQLVETKGVRWLAAEFNRHKGEMLMRRGQLEAAEQLFMKALAIAAEQGAKFWELRAAISLALLFRDKGRRSEGYDLLSPIYGWFTEGFDTSDLLYAKALLSELN